MIIIFIIIPDVVNLMFAIIGFPVEGGFFITILPGWTYSRPTQDL